MVGRTKLQTVTLRAVVGILSPTNISPDNLSLNLTIVKFRRKKTT